MFLGEGSLAAAPTPRAANKGIHPVIKVVDDKCLYVASFPYKQKY
jgi:kinesin family protein 18/19